MGTTCECVFLRDNILHIVHIGDSRTYLVRNQKAYQLTKDHSLVQEMVSRGEITEDEALVHPNKNFITRAIGVKSTIKVDYTQYEYKPGDIVIICTDGLTNCVSKEEIAEVVNNNPKNQITDKLVEEAKFGGGTDNITVITIY